MPSLHGGYSRWNAGPSQEEEIQYLDLDLDNESDNSKSTLFGQTKDNSSSSRFDCSGSLAPSVRESSTVYKTVDFVKTEAFNKLRSNLDRGHNVL